MRELDPLVRSCGHIPMRSTSFRMAARSSNAPGNHWANAQKAAGVQLSSPPANGVVNRTAAARTGPARSWHTIGPCR
eukprot:3251951-Pyramimonas_sp.AAC.1